MTCTPVTLPNGARAIVCTQTRRCRCGQRATRLCDWKLPADGLRPRRTCDRALCERCSTQPAAGKDLCQEHAGDWRAWLARKQARAG